MGNLMSKTMIKPGPDLLQRVGQAFLDHGYSGLSMVTMAKSCGFTQRALYYYFSNKEDAFRAMIQYRNDEAMGLAREAGKAMRAKGGSALDIIAEILDVRYGGTRRRVNRSPHMVELNAEVFKRCRDIVIQVAITFQAELEALIVDLEKRRMLTLNGRFTAAQIAQGLADGGRAVNQALPVIADEDYKGRYRHACEMVLYGCATMPKPNPSKPNPAKPKPSSPKTPKRKMPQRK